MGRQELLTTALFVWTTFRSRTSRRLESLLGRRLRSLLPLSQHSTKPSPSWVSVLPPSGPAQAHSIPRFMLEGLILRFRSTARSTAWPRRWTPATRIEATRHLFLATNFTVRACP